MRQIPKIRFFRAIVMALCVGIAGAVVLTYLDKKENAAFDPKYIADCFHDTPDALSVDGDCLDKKVTKILTRESTMDLLSYITSSTSPQVLRDDCHPIAHAIGEATFAKAGSVDEALLMCPNSCNYGCIHGVVAAAVLKELGPSFAKQDMEHASVSTIETIGASYCKKADSLCHAIGHILFIATKSYPQSLEVCKKISANLSTIYCYEGVFMQASGDFSSIFPGTGPVGTPTDDFGYPCTLFTAPGYLHTCFEYLPSFQLKQLLMKGVPVANRADMLIDRCEHFSGLAQSECFFGFGLFSSLSNKQLGDPVSLSGRCDTMKTLDERESCTLGVSFRFAHASQFISGVKYCDSVQETERRTLCYNILFQESADQYNGLIGSICSIDAPSCDTEYQTYLKHKDSLPVYRYGVHGKQN